MPQKLLKFKELNASLLLSAQHNLSSWLPGGRVNGREYVVGSTGGEAGHSLSINMQTGVWKDFSTGQGGADLISLYAEIHGLGQGEAFKKLAGDTPIKKGDGTKAKEQTKTLIPPPKTKVPDFNHHQHGKPSSIYKYCSIDGQLLFYITRFDLDEGKKLFRPWSYDKDSGWVAKAWPKPRPLFGLEQLSEKVLLVEGEKACLAARKLASSRSVITWAGGSSAIKQTDWGPLYGKDVLIWPDNDDAGLRAAAQIAEILLPKKTSVSVIDIASTDEPKGFDAADFKGTQRELGKFLKPLIKKITPPPEEPKTPAKVKPKPVAHPEPQMNTPGVILDGNGKPVCSSNNAFKVLASLPDISKRIWFDTFHLDYFSDLFILGGQKVADPQPLSDEVVADIRYQLQEMAGFYKINKGDVEEAIKKLARQKPRNEPLEWLTSLEWDHTPRLDTWLIDYANAEDNEYTRAVGKNIILAACKRIQKPGSKFDHVLVLKGDQGIGKSQLLQALGDKYHAEFARSIKREGKDAALNFKSKMFVELTEGAALSGMSNDDKKAFISSNMDEYRAPYSRASRKWPRTYILCITTNNDNFLDDDSGDRRYWPVSVGECNYEKLKEDRHHLFAEAFYRLNLEENYFQVPWELAEAERQKFTFTNELDDMIIEYADTRAAGYVKISDLYINVIKAGDKSVERLDRKMQLYIAQVLRSHGWVKSRRNLDGSVAKIWIREEDAAMDLPNIVQKRREVINHAPQGI